MHQAFALPELIEQLSHHLDSGSLASCAQVSKLWLDMFAPHLWARFGLFPPPSRSSDNSSKTMWERLFEGELLSTEEVGRVQPVIAKYGHRVRALVVRSHHALRIYQRYFPDLKVLHCEWERWSKWDGDVKQVQRDIEDFVKDRRGSLDTLYLSNWLISDQSRITAISSIQCLRAANDFVPEADYCPSLDSLPPYTQAISIYLKSLTSISTPLQPQPHWHLRYLRLTVPSFNSQALKYILESFPSLQDLTVEDEAGNFALDLNSSKLEIDGEYEDDEVARMISLLPNLRCMYYWDMGEQSFRALAQYCPKLQEVDADRAAQTWIQEDNFEIVLPPTLCLLLESCPELQTINCPDHAIHIRHVMNGRPWVSKKLEFLRCQIVGVPKFYLWDRELVESMQSRWSAMGEEERAMLTGQEREIVVVLDQRETCRQAMERQFGHVPEMREKRLFGQNYLDSRFLPE
ncbi:hypothetical protein DFQ26_009712 [Actinomortierella ambigua]|nr:hypothetical protein DFQ26_009712 [Actinomortierella ambigua]